MEKVDCNRFDKEHMIKIDLHTHAKPISKCSKLTAQELIDLKIKQGYGGMVLTDHCLGAYYFPVSYINYVEEVIEEYIKARDYGICKGFKVYLGLEVNIQKPSYGDWLLYGITEDFLRKSPPLNELSQQELYKLCVANNVLLVSAHPFRSGMFLGDTSCMDGVEINCTPCDYYKKDQVFDLAKEKGLLVTCGTDCHFEDDRFYGGIIIPKQINDSVDLAKFMKKKN